MTRAFVAIVPPDTVLDGVAALADALELGDVHRTTRPQWHVTLQFLGNRADIDAVGDALEDLPVAPARVQLGGGGAFPKPRRGRVLWLGFREGADAVAHTAREVGARLAALGHEPEAREFHPHLTVARAKTTTDFTDAVAMIDARHALPAWTVAEVVVFESVLRRDGAQYVPRRSIALGARPGS